jgi:hypothetical protein
LRSRAKDVAVKAENVRVGIEYVTIISEHMCFIVITVMNRAVLADVVLIEEKLALYCTKSTLIVL